jgi:hexosaminidase
MTAPTAEVKETLDEAVKIFNEYLLQYHPEYKRDGVSPFPENRDDDPISNNTLVIDIATVWDTKKLTLGTEESYVLSLQSNDARNGVSTLIAANTFFGARNGLETLSQLIAYDEDTNSLKTLDRATISDGPVFAYRGLLIDTSRNFLPIENIKRVIDGMSYNKLNMLHWHITDTHSFPFYSKSVPEMTKYGAYSKRQIYSVEEATELVEYARVRGVKIVAEFDAPAHAGNGWEWGPAAGKGEMALCVNKEPWAKYCVEPPCGQLNPANENMYEVLGKIYQDMLEIFDNELFHMGGDEVKLDCWLENEEITEYLKKQGKNNTAETLIELWGEFQEKAYNLVKDKQQVKENNVTAIMWTSELASIEHAKQYLPADKYVIQIWTTAQDAVIPFLIKNNYKTIFSNYDALYLDCGFGAWIGEGNNWCSPYKGWQTVYENNPLKLLSPALTEEEIDAAYKAGQILGGEAALWAEQVDELTLDGKIWPRGSALAERLWSNPNTTWYAAEPRIIQQRHRLLKRGLRPDRLQPEWCRQNEQLCYG